LLKQLSDKEFETLLRDKHTAVVELYSEQCETCMCKSVYSQIEQVMSFYGERLTFACINIDQYPTIASNYSLEGAPHVLFIKEGRLVERMYGYAPTSLLNMMIQKLHL
jgi:thioredoxin 1